MSSFQYSRAVCNLVSAAYSTLTTGKFAPIHITCATLGGMLYVCSSSHAIEPRDLFDAVLEWRKAGVGEIGDEPGGVERINVRRAHSRIASPRLARRSASPLLARTAEAWPRRT